MSKDPLGKLTQIDLREYWQNEASDFTPWLAQEENIKLLGDTLNLDLEVAGIEQGVGPFRADILCKDTVTGKYILIENQLEKTDHTHLGQIFTYAAGSEAVVIIWIAKKFTDEHRAAIDWLNNISKDGFDFFGIEIELWRIADSPFAPKFNVVCRPNNWAESVRTNIQMAGELSDTKKTQFDFWTQFKEHIENTKTVIRCANPKPQNYMDHPIGKSGFTISSFVSTWDSVSNKNSNIIRAELCLKDKYAKNYFLSLEKQKESIEQNLGESLHWYNPENAQLCRIFLQKETDFMKRELWPEQFEWLKNKLEKMHQVFYPIIKNLNIEDSAEITT